MVLGTSQWTTSQHATPGGLTHLLVQLPHAPGPAQARPRYGVSS